MDLLICGSLLESRFIDLELLSLVCSSTTATFTAVMTLIRGFILVSQIRDLGYALLRPLVLVVKEVFH